MRKFIKLSKTAKEEIKELKNMFINDLLPLIMVPKGLIREMYGISTQYKRKRK